MKKYTIKHTHAQVGHFNGSLYFIVDNRLLRVGVHTPNFNDFGEWRLDGFVLSDVPYDPSTNTVSLTPYSNFKDIKINETDLKFLDLFSKTHKDDITDKEINSIIKILHEISPNFNPSLAGGRYKGEKDFTIFNDIEYEDGSSTREDIKYKKWKSIDESLKTPFEKIFYPILYQFRKEYLKK